MVDDDDNVRQVLCEIVQADGYRVTGVRGGREALDLLKKTWVDLALVDLMMPDMNGWQLLRAIKTDHPGVLVVLITGYINEQGESILTDRKADGYLVKPVDRRRIQSLLRSLLYPRNLGRAAEVVAVDDDQTTLQLIDHALGERGLYVIPFEDADEALRHISRTPPDLVITDLGLPGLDGFDLCRAVRTSPDTARIPLLILTASPSRENVVRAIQLGVNGFVAKPFDPEALAEKVVQALRQAGGPGAD
jgi:DNA-binding response OmpR family regulator